ncbi:MAG: hypothetical protein HYW24_00830 [Candidatus Aenigmarchaeota archaeon]|nr:hypothetical protein [Candidatus Aenigmarchaeota archaeon]
MKTLLKIDKKYEGRCIAVYNGKVVFSHKNMTTLIQKTNQKYPNGEATITTVPKGSKILIL